MQENENLDMKENEDIILHAENIVKIYKTGAGSLTVLDHLNLDVQRGTLVMLMGRSGSGKTTLMNLLSTLDDPTEGDISFIGKKKSPQQGKETDVSGTADETGTVQISQEKEEPVAYSEMTEEDKERFRRYRMGFVFQSVALIPVMTARENIDFSLRTAGYARSEKNFGDADYGAIDRRIDQVLENVGLADRADHYSSELSGGERQRIAIARAIADEPTGALDTQTGIHIAELFLELTRKENLTVVMTTHDIRLSEYADKIIRM